MQRNCFASCFGNIEFQERIDSLMFIIKPLAVKKLTTCLNLSRSLNRVLDRGKRRNKDGRKKKGRTLKIRTYYSSQAHQASSQLSTGPTLRPKATQPRLNRANLQRVPARSTHQTQIHIKQFHKTRLSSNINIRQ